MHHERFDFATWNENYPLEALKPRTESDSYDQYLGCPRFALHSVQFRKQLTSLGHNLGPAVPTDICLWNLGESERRDVTKIGGVPYWPKSLEWPAVQGQPMTFVAQFCFADSRDIVPSLPGDILTILALDDDYSDVLTAWFKLGVPLAKPSRLPKPRWKISPCHAVLLRAFDYPKADHRLFDALTYPLSKHARIWCGSKIGGALFDTDLPSRMQAEFLCQLWSDSGYVNYPNYESIPDELGQDSLMISDVGGYSFYHETETYSNWHCG